MKKKRKTFFLGEEMHTENTNKRKEREREKVVLNKEDCLVKNEEKGELHLFTCACAVFTHELLEWSAG
jgi:hypothetical protein